MKRTVSILFTVIVAILSASSAWADRATVMGCMQKGWDANSSGNPIWYGRNIALCVDNNRAFLTSQECLDIARSLLDSAEDKEDLDVRYSLKQAYESVYSTQCTGR
jgi:hypothetical protein